MSKERAREKRIRELTERGMRTREGRPFEWTYLIQTDPDMFQAYQNIYEKSLMEGKELPAKYRELICMGILAFRGNRDGVVSHARRAHEFGATLQEILDAAEITLIPGGAPTFLTYLAAAETIKEDEMKAAKKT
jgi:AhpD family alkylhydroperoxidase